MTKKEFILEVTNQLLEAPRKVLAGHGIQAGVLQEILRRPDVMSKLGAILYSLKTAKKGATGLKKAKNFQIKGYKTFANMNMSAREDIENFINGLDESDANAFTNEDNVITILMLPNKNVDVDIEDPDSVSQGVVAGKTVFLPFMSAVRKEYKIPGGMYLVVMIGNSAVRTMEEKIAEREAKRKKAKIKKLTSPAGVRKQIQAKVKKLKALQAKSVDTLKGLYADKKSLERQNAQLAKVAAMLGAENGETVNLEDITRNFSSYEEGILRTLSDDDYDAYLEAAYYFMHGNKRKAKTALAVTEDPDKLWNLLISQPRNVIDSDKKAVRAQIKKLVELNNTYLDELGSTVEPAKRRNLQSKISRVNSKIKSLRARLGIYKDLKKNNVVTKAQMLQKVNADIEAEIANGATISQALNTAIAKLNVNPQQKQVIRQQVMQQVADGTPMQYAAQSAIQNIPAEELAGAQQVAQQDTSALSDNYDVTDLLNELL